jgi:hypothetical protein
MESFKVKWSRIGSGGSFLVTFNKWKEFNVTTLSGSRAGFNTVISTVLKLAKETLGEESLQHYLYATISL